MYNSQEAHDKFRELFKDKADFEFRPKENFLEHFEYLEYNSYTKECVICWLEHPSTPLEFTKKDCYMSIGLQKPNKAFNTFWNFLTAPRTNGHYMVYDKDTKTWIFLN
jgi:hypothetical protein